MKLTTIVAALAASTISIYPTGESVAAGSSSSCVCTASYTPGEFVGLVDAAEGSVSVSGPKGFVPITPGARLLANSIVKTGPLSSAHLLIGTGCQLSLDGSSMATLSTQGDGICVIKTEPEQAASGDSTLLLVGGATVAIGTLVVGLGLRAPASP